MERERDGLVFIADGRVPADFFNELIRDFDKYDIQEMKEDIAERGVSVYDLTDVWDDYIEFQKRIIDDLIDGEYKGVLVELNKYWKEQIKKYIGQN